MSPFLTLPEADNPKANTRDSTGYPFLAAVVSEAGSSKKDVARVEVNSTMHSWQWATDLGFPFNIDDMIDYCVGTLPGSSSGIFGIDDSQGKPTLTFAGLSGSGPGPRAPVQVNLPIVANPRSVTTTLDQDGFTNVLLGGDGVLHIASQNCVDSVPAGTIYKATVSDPNMQGIHKLQVAQHGQGVAVWALNGDNILVGQSANLKLNDDEGYDEFLSTGPAVPLLPRGDELQTFDAIVQTKLQSQQVFCLKRDGSVSCLQQPGDSKIWSEQPFRVPDLEDVQDINTYSCHIRFKDANGEPLVKSEAQLITSSQISCVVNGMTIVLGQSSTKVKTDTQGVISITFPAPDLNSPNVTVTGPITGSVAFNPAVKAIEKLSSVARTSQLGQVRRPDGNLLFPNVDGPTSKAIAELGQKFMEMVPSTSETRANTSAVHVQSMTVMASSHRDGNGSLWELWHGIVSGVEKVLDFAYEAGVFIVKTAKNLLRFVVETAEQALAALSGLFKLIETAIEHALIWLAEKLDWDSILDTMTFFNETFNVGIDMLQDLIAEGGDAVDEFFENFEREVGSWHLPPTLPDKVASLKPDLDRARNSQANSFSNNPCYNWANSQIENGGSKERMAAVADEPDVASFSTVLKAIFDQIFAPLWENFKETLSEVWGDLKNLFNKDSSASWSEVFKNLGVDLILGIVRGIRKALHGIFAVSETFLSWIKALLNKPMDIWVISKVFRKVTGGKELTMLNLCSLLLAVPTAWAFKLIFGKKPRDFPQVAKLLSDIQSQSGSKVLQGTVSTTAKDRSSPARAQNDLIHLPVTLKSQVPMGFLKAFKANTGAVAGQAFTPQAVKNSSPIDVKKLEGKPSVTRLKWLWRLGNLIKGAGVIVYTVIDTVITGLTWPTLGPDVHTEDDGRWKKGPAVYLAFVLTVTSFPFEKFDRNAGGITIRILTWGATGTLNIIKAGLPDIVKPGIAGLVGGIDMVAYIVALIVEGSGGDGALEISHRLMTDAWALGSAYNGASGGKEPWGLGITIGIGVLNNIEGMLLAKHQVKYFEEKAWDEDYSPPTWSSSLNGSLW